MKAFQELGCLFWERAWRTECCFGMEDIAMLLFYLPIIIFEAMLEANIALKRAGPDGDIKKSRRRVEEMAWADP
jgi:hypothetical protein